MRFEMQSLLKKVHKNTEKPPDQAAFQIQMVRVGTTDSLPMRASAANKTESPVCEMHIEALNCSE